MFTISVRITKRQIIAAGAAFAIAFAGGIWAKAAFTQLRGTPAQSAAVVKINKAAGKTNEQRIDFLNSLGWEVEPQEEEILEVFIPKEFDNTIEAYNQLQKSQGCDLTKYEGKRCKRYTYIVTNYPSDSGNIRANILTYKDKVIGGDICSVELDGFMHGFAAPKANTSEKTTRSDKSSKGSKNASPSESKNASDSKSVSD